MLTLGIETSCDDTSAAVLADGGRVLSSVVSSQVRLHAEYGGIVPELASRAHIRNIRPVVAEALEQAGVTFRDLGLVAVTHGPGLIGSLLVGVNYAKALAGALGVPLVALNHLEGHFFSPFLEHPEIAFPVVHLIVSGGHTTLYHAREPGDCEILAATRDDAAGEAFDKAAKMAGLPYPGGPPVDRIAAACPEAGARFALPRISDGSLDFSFSGLKTALLQILQKEGIGPAAGEDEVSPRLAALLKGFQSAVVEQLLHRAEHFCRLRKPRGFLLGGGVACNSLLRAEANRRFSRLGIPVFYPSPGFTTDNAAMIALAGQFRFGRGEIAPAGLNADANLRFGHYPADRR
ncbi:MAG: tRNA (adenosine(37)-N6)-threonylcarbamoyltransferase complex transferase subunit TsaD [Acidobacteria bacterium]|nr:tRNA (adenosine(37)-N6)-threonylcarbamoyltransferase complex transferase subunit TsaD [Acidobacteriota bacterium]